MARSCQLAGMVAGVVVVALVAALVQPEWASDLRVDPRGWVRSIDVRSRNEEESAALDRQCEAVDRRIQAKRRITADSIDGRVTLFEAAALFRRLDAEPPVLPPSPDLLGDSEEERACLQVIKWARQRLHESYPDGADELVAPFKEELRLHKQLHGKVVLPELAADPPK